MTVYEAILKRRSVRTFLPKKVEDEKIDILLKAAMAAPSACNKKPWLFYVVKDEEKIAELRKVSRYSNMEAPLIIIVAGDEKRSLSKKPNDFWIQDCSAATENILLSAIELDLGTCWNGLFPMVTPVKKVKEILSLEDNVIPLALIHVGYPLTKAGERTQYDEKRITII